MLIAERIHVPQNIEAHDIPSDRGSLPCTRQLPSPLLQQTRTLPLALQAESSLLLMVADTVPTGMRELGAAEAGPTRTIAARVKALVKYILIDLINI